MVDGYTAEISLTIKMSAFFMAGCVYFQGMNEEEMILVDEIYGKSRGRIRVDLRGSEASRWINTALRRRDAMTLIAGPAAAACGVLHKMSGCRPGFTGRDLSINWGAILDFRRRRRFGDFIDQVNEKGIVSHRSGWSISHRQTGDPCAAWTLRTVDNLESDCAQCHGVRSWHPDLMRSCWMSIRGMEPACRRRKRQ